MGRIEKELYQKYYIAIGVQYWKILLHPKPANHANGASVALVPANIHASVPLVVAFPL